MLRGATPCKFLIWFVPARRSQVTFAGQAGALTRLVAPPRVAISARMPSMAELERDLQGREVPAGGEGPLALERQDVGVVAGQAAVSERQGGVHRGLLDVGEQRRWDELAHVGGGGAEGPRRP